MTDAIQKERATIKTLVDDIAQLQKEIDLHWECLVPERAALSAEFKKGWTQWNTDEIRAKENEVEAMMEELEEANKRLQEMLDELQYSLDEVSK